MTHSFVRGLLFVLVTTISFVGFQEVDAATEEEAVKNVLNSFQDCWNRHDMEGFATLFAEDADFVNVRGMRWVGRAAIKEAHTQTHAGIFKASRITIKETIIRFIKPDVAVSRSFWDLVGHTTPTGEPAPPRKGILTNVLVKQNDKWQIVVTQNTDIAPPPQ